MTAATSTRIPEWVVTDRLRKARETAGLEQSELAELIGVSRATISNYEGGRTSPRKIVLNAWAMATGVPVEWIRDGMVPSDDGPAGGNIGERASSSTVELRTFNPSSSRGRIRHDNVTHGDFPPLKAA